ncbi:uncharacterized protein [Littorina saxatilis]|uniref:uncharacterized protein n=1 Tax=Littorina saxatilis TaxID=31220 RepID=UPI0038B60467
MNQQQRAGKHPSFVRDRKPYGLKKETFRRECTASYSQFIPKRFKEKKLCDAVNAVEHTDSRHSFALDIVLYWYCQPETTYDILKTLRIEKNSTEILSALFTVCYTPAFTQKFADERYTEIREEVLHLAAEEAMVNENHDLVSWILRRVHNRKLVMCMLSEGASVLSVQHFLQYIKLVYKNHTRSLELCLLEAVMCRRWSIALKLVKVFEQNTDTGLEAVEEENGLIQNRRLCTRLLHLTLSRALESREWDLVQTCLHQGGDTATACTETGFDLNARTGDTRTTVLRDAMTYLGEETKMAQKLLQAGANPDVKDGIGETVIHSAIKGKRWKLVTLLLQYSSEAGEIASKMYNAETLLHIVCREGQVEILQTLLLKGANPLVEDVRGNTLMMTAIKTEQGRENLIRTLIQNGVATHQALVSQSRLTSLRKKGKEKEMALCSPTWMAIARGQLRTAMMLYSSGACPAVEIHEVATSVSIREKQEHSKQHGMLDFLNDISSQPRSLLDSCALKISHLIGCGPERDVRAAILGLPNKLRGLVLQDHVVNPDFLKDCPPDPPRRDIFSGRFGSSWGMRFLRNYQPVFSLSQRRISWDMPFALNRYSPFQEWFPRSSVHSRSRQSTSLLSHPSYYFDHLSSFSVLGDRSYRRRHRCSCDNLDRYSTLCSEITQ